MIRTNKLLLAALLVILLAMASGSSLAQQNTDRELRAQSEPQHYYALQI